MIIILENFLGDEHFRTNEENTVCFLGKKWYKLLSKGSLMCMDIGFNPIILGGGTQFCLLQKIQYLYFKIPL